MGGGFNHRSYNDIDDEDDSRPCDSRRVSRRISNDAASQGAEATIIPEKQGEECVGDDTYAMSQLDTLCRECCSSDDDDDDGDDDDLDEDKEIANQEDGRGLAGDENYGDLDQLDGEGRLLRVVSNCEDNSDKHTNRLVNVDALGAMIKQKCQCVDCGSTNLKLGEVTYGLATTMILECRDCPNQSRKRCIRAVPGASTPRFDGVTVVTDGKDVVPTSFSDFVINHNAVLMMQGLGFGLEKEPYR